MLLPAPFLFVLFLGVLSGNAEPEGAFAAGLLVLLVVGLPLLLVLGHERYRRGLGMRRDARRGEVYRFERIAPNPGDDLSGEPAWFEVLPTTRLVWRTESGMPPERDVVEFTDVADTPERAATAAQWTEPLDPVGAPGVEVNHRELTAAERDELLRHSRHAGWRPLRAAIPLTLWAGGVLYLAAQTGRLPSGHQLTSFLLLLVSTAAADALAAGGLLAAWRLQKDYRVGRVIIVRTSRTDDQGVDGLSPPSEFLPFSRRGWTVAGEPAPWRVR